MCYIMVPDGSFMSCGQLFTFEHLLPSNCSCNLTWKTQQRDKMICDGE